MEAAVDRGTVPCGVLSEGETHNFLVEGSLAGLYGLECGGSEGTEATMEDKVTQLSKECGSGALSNTRDDDGSEGVMRATATVPGACAVVLRQGDCLLVPAGLYHDVEATSDAAALSVTIRFTLTPGAGIRGGGGASSPCATVGGGEAGSACVRPLGHWGVHVFEDEEEVCALAAATGTDSTKVALTSVSHSRNNKKDDVLKSQSEAGAFFRRWRDETTKSDGGTSSVRVRKTVSKAMPTAAIATPATRASLFQKWRDVMSSSASEAKTGTTAGTAYPRPLASEGAAPLGNPPRKSRAESDGGDLDIDD